LDAVRRYPSLLLLAMLISSPARAATDDDAELWTTLSASGAIHGRILGHGEAIFRFSAEEDRLYQADLRGALGYQATDALAVQVGYTRVANVEDGPDVHEDRIHQQVGLKLGDALGGSLAARIRFEQRMVERGEETGLRLRQQIAYWRPLTERFGLQLSAEAFFALNDTDWGARRGFSRLRSAVGLSHRLLPGTDLEIGYLNQLSRVAGGRDAMGHALTLGLSYGF